MLTAYPVSSGSQGHDAAGTVGRSSTEKVSPERGGVSHERSRRPRPDGLVLGDHDQALRAACVGSLGDERIGRAGLLDHLHLMVRQAGGVDGWAGGGGIAHGR